MTTKQQAQPPLLRAIYKSYALLAGLLFAQSLWLGFVLYTLVPSPQALTNYAYYVALLALAFVPSIFLMYASVVTFNDRGRTPQLIAGILFANILLFAGLGVPYVIGGLLNSVGYDCAGLFNIPESCIDSVKFAVIVPLTILPFGWVLIILVIGAIFKGIGAAKRQ